MNKIINNAWAREEAISSDCPIDRNLLKEHKSVELQGLTVGTSCYKEGCEGKAPTQSAVIKGNFWPQKALNNWTFAHAESLGER